MAIVISTPSGLFTYKGPAQCWHMFFFHHRRYIVYFNVCVCVRMCVCACVWVLYRVTIIIAWPECITTAFIFYFSKHQCTIVILKFHSTIETEACTNVILRSGFQFAKSGFKPLKPKIRCNLFWWKTAIFKYSVYWSWGLTFRLSSTTFRFKIRNFNNNEPKYTYYRKKMVPSLFLFH